MNKYIAYYRVSTQKQGTSGLGLESQQNICMAYIDSQQGTLIAEFKDIESGSSKTRTGLLQAIDYCKEHGCTLVIAKLDRMSRDIEFTFKVMNTGISIYFCDMPHVNTMILGVFASVAQYERELISDRTKKALQQAKKNGVKIGQSADNYGKSDGHKDRFTAGRVSAARSKNENVIRSERFNAIAKVLLRNVPELDKIRTKEPLFFLKWKLSLVKLDIALKTQIAKDLHDFYPEHYMQLPTPKEVANICLAFFKTIDKYNDFNNKY